MPPEQTIIAVTALLAGLLLVGVMLAGRRVPGDGSVHDAEPGRRMLAPRAGGAARLAAERPQADPASTLRVAWWLTVTIVLLGVGISGSFAADQGPIFGLGAAAVAAVVLFHELLGHVERGRLLRLAEVVAAVALVGGLLALTGFASSPFAMLFALVSVAAALAYGPRAGLTAAGFATAAFAAVLLIDPRLPTYGPEDALRLSIGFGATWLLAFVAIAYAGHQRRAMARAIDLARTDPLTGLFNRSQLLVTLDQEVSRTRRSDRGFCLLMIDVDGLKSINDTDGHLRGDEVLRALGSVIRTSIRTVDSAYRFGGDEFVVLLPETDIVGAFVVAEKIRAGAEEIGQSLAGPEPQMSVSIGLVSHPEDGLSAEELMTAADRAMYQAKKLGKNQISGNPRPRPALLARRPGPLHQPEVEGSRAAQPGESQAGKTAARADPVTAPAEERAVAVQLGPVVVANASPNRRVEEVDDADPAEVRRRIASASRSFDPDHQIRRAMDAFLSPVPGDRQPPGPNS